MNTAKKNIVLLVLLITQAALIVFLYRPGQNVAPAADSIFTALTPEKVTSMTITDDQGESVSLVKKDGAWQLSQGEFPADQPKIEKLTKKFADSKSSRLVSQTAASHARLKVAETDFNRKIELGQGETKTIFFLGTAPSAKSIHLRLAEAKEVYQINDLSSWEVQADNESWWQTKYLSQPLTDLKGVTIANSHGTIELIKEEEKGWQIKGEPDEPLDVKRIDTLLNSVSEIGIASYLAKDFVAKGKPVVTLTYQTKEGATTLEAWAKEKPEDQDLVIKSSTSDFYAKVKEYVVKEAMEIKGNALIAQPPALPPASKEKDTGAPEESLDQGVPEIPAPGYQPAR